MGKTQQEEINRLINRAINLDYIKNETEAHITINSFGNAWISLPYKNHKGHMTFTVLPNENKTSYEAVAGRLGK